MSRRVPGSAASSTSATTACSRPGSIGAARRTRSRPPSSPGSRPTASRPRRSPRVSPTSSGGRRGCSSSARAPRSRSMSARRTTSRRPGRRCSTRSPRSRLGSVSATTACAPYRGRSVVDLRPGDAGGKREAVERLIDATGRARSCRFGDDLSDADAFDAVLAARDDGPDARADRSRCTGGSRRPPEVLARADLVVASARDVGRVLGALAGRIAREPSDAGPDARDADPRERRDRVGGRLHDPMKTFGKTPSTIVSAVATARPPHTSRAVARRPARRSSGRACTCRRRPAGSRTRPPPR